MRLGSWGASCGAGCPFWLPARGRSTVEAPMAGGKGSPAPNICQGMPGARKYRPGVTLPGHNVGCPQPTGSWLSVPLKGVKTAGSQQCTMLPSAPQGPDGIAGTQWRCDPPHAMLSPPNPPETARLCGLLPPPAPIELSRDWDAQSGLTSGGGGGAVLCSRRGGCGSGSGSGGSQASLGTRWGAWL